MDRQIKILAVSCGFAAAAAVPTLVHAQDFLGGLLRGAARSTAQGLAERAVSAAMAPRTPAATEGPAGMPPVADVRTSPREAPAAGAGEAGLPADFPLPRPLNYSPSLRRPTQLEFSQADRDAVRAFDEIGRYDCSDCEGGRGFDSWPRHEISNLGSGNYALENRLGALQVGEALRWTGSRTGVRYAITVVGDRGIGPWECKQLKWTGDRGETRAERMGLICKPTANWHTVL